MIHFIVNVQHNCYDGKCTPTGRRARFQERLETEIQEPMLIHTDDDSFVLNMHVIHNAALLWKVLPRHLTKPLPYIEPAKRLEEHNKMVESLRSLQTDSRTKQASARKAHQEAKNKQVKGSHG
ncbi:hypothetical protein ABKN59_011827 [Abortiporus biennis]